MNIAKTAKESFVKVYNFIQREFAYPTQVQNQGKYIPYFAGNDNFPVELAQLVQGSPTATSCLSTLTDFIAGEGFNEGEDLENLVLNRQGLKFFQFHTVCSDSIAHDWGVASIVKYNSAGGITEIYDVPFGYCRLKAPDDNGIISKILYNPYFGTALYKSQDNVEYDVYNPSQAVVQMGKDKKWKGQIAWLGIRTKKHPFYPVPDYYSARHWMSVEKNAGVYFDENLENGFLTPTIIKLMGNPNDSSGLKDGNDNDIPKGKVFSDMMTQEFSGAKRVGKMMAFWGNSKEEFPELEAFPSGGNPDMYRVQDEHAIKKITIATKVPGVLANINDTNNFSGEQIRPAVKLMQQRVVRPQTLLIDYYMQFFQHFVFPEGFQKPENITIVHYNPYPEAETVDAQTWGVLTDEEKRKWVKDNTEIEIIDPPPTNTTPAPPAQNKFVNLHFNSYPEKAKDTVKRALDWQQKFGIKCSKPTGLALSEAILNGTPLGPKEIKRLSTYLSKNLVFNDRSYKDSCEKVLFDAWGGVEMMKWANEKVKELKGDE